MNDKGLIISYVHHADKCFYVVTFNRDSSAMLGPRRYAETLVYECDPKTFERGTFLGQFGTGTEGSIFNHLERCQFLHDTGSAEIPAEGESAI